MTVVLVALVLGMTSGCFSAREKGRVSEPPGADKRVMEASVPAAPSPQPGADLSVSPPAGGGAGEGEEGAAVPATAVDRKLIRTASISLEVESTDAALKSLESMAASFGGFVGNTSVTRHADGSQSGTVTLRVPVGKFTEAVEKVRALGRVEHVETQVQDVTNQYVDLDARLRNAKREETEILKLFERSGKLSDIIEIESKLAEVRGRIEQLEGQMRVMNEQISLCTLTVTVHEKGEAALAALERYDVRYHLRSAWRALVGLLEGLLTFVLYLIIVGWVFWFPVIVAVWYIRRRRKAAAQRRDAPPTT